MKKLLTFAVVATLALGTFTAQAQNKFRGIVKYEATGSLASKLPEEYRTGELKVMDGKLYANQSTAFLFTQNQFAKCIIVDERTVTMCYDFSPILNFLATQDVTLPSYSGDGRIIGKNTASQQDVDSLTIPVTEGYYLEYVAGESKKIAGQTAKLCRIHRFDESGDDTPLDVWYCDEMGPQNNFMFMGIAGIPLEFALTFGDNTLEIRTVEVKSSKVKDVDFLMPDGYKALSEEEMKTFFEELGEELKYLQGDEDDED
ncbi:MAG: hypothetical protein IJ684_02675 [Bacteroidales bacterium]|nr:hypothetical protein [Bacteroidales bacterium]